MTSRERLGGVVHTYQKFDPGKFPSPTAPPPDLVGSAFEHALFHGDLRELSEEELARAVRIDPSQIAGLGPSLDSLLAMLRERKRKILETYEAASAQHEARRNYESLARELKPPARLRDAFERAVIEEQLRDLERLWYASGGERGKFGRHLMRLVGLLGDKYQLDELLAKYVFTGRQRLTIPEALEIKEELETIDRLIQQLEEALANARIGVIDLDELSRFADEGQLDELAELNRRIQEYLRELAAGQGLERSARGYQLTPQAYRLFQGRLLDEIFANLQSARTGRHTGPIAGEGAVELPSTKDYEFGDSVANMDIPGSFVNALVRQGPGLPVRLEGRDIQIHRTRNQPKCATAVLMDMSGSMRYGGQYVNVKRMALALDGLIRREYPGDFLQFIEVYTFAKPRASGEIISLLPKPVTLYDSIVRLRADMSDPNITEQRIPPHFTNLQHGMLLARRYLSVQDTPNRQIIMITDGLPTAHFEDQNLYLLYPADPRTEAATLREGQLCKTGRHHHQPLPASQLVADAGRCALRAQAGRIDPRPGLLHRRPRSRPLRGLGLPEPPEANPRVRATSAPATARWPAPRSA